MPIPDYQSFMLPLLKLASDRKTHSLREAYEKLAEEFDLAQHEREELLPSGTQQTYKNRVGWARTYLKKAGLLRSPKRGHFEITDRGMEELKSNPTDMNTAYLNKYDEFRDFRTRNNDAPNEPSAVATTSSTPQEAIENSIEELNSQLAQELLDALLGSSPGFFEQVVVELLVKMGYGGSRKEAGQVVGRSGDEGIDGIIKEDRLGLEAIYVQAKRWENPVSRPEIQKFVGALQGQRARKGIFITTSRYTADARDYVDRIENRVVLIDGEELARLMIEHDVGTTNVNVYRVRRIDSDYFEEA
jgi:restriction system protein